MKKCLFIAIMMSSSIAIAETGKSYLGAGYHVGKYEEDGLPGASPTAIKLEYGRYVTDAVAIEGHFNLGLSEDTINVNGLDAEVEVKQAISIFVKGDLNVSESFAFYGLLGYTKGKLEGKIPDLDLSFSESDAGLSYGGGIEAKISSGLSFSAEYIMYLSEDDYDYSGFNLGIAKMF